MIGGPHDGEDEGRACPLQGQFTPAKRLLAEGRRARHSFLPLRRRDDWRVELLRRQPLLQSRLAFALVGVPPGPASENTSAAPSHSLFRAHGVRYGRRPCALLGPRTSCIFRLGTSHGGRQPSISPPRNRSARPRRETADADEKVWSVLILLGKSNIRSGL
jgi:hypothetical protein